MPDELATSATGEPGDTAGSVPGLTSKQKSVARHALGLSSRQRESYRNRFVTGEDSDDYPLWAEMEARGFAQRRDGSTLPFSGDHLFWLTLEGALLALNPGDTLSKEDFKP